MLRKHEYQVRVFGLLDLPAHNPNTTHKFLAAPIPNLASQVQLFNVKK
jgi:hypothetical protein